jgi:hypothetical protein
MGQGRLPKNIAGAVVLALHLIAVWALLSVAPPVRPPGLPQFVSLWAEEPEPNSPPPVLAPRLQTHTPAPINVAEDFTPAPDSLAETSVDQSTNGRPAPWVDWGREAAEAARRGVRSEGLQSFSAPAPTQRKPCVAKENPWFSEPKAVAPPGTVPIGKSCFQLGSTIQCVARLGKAQSETSELVAALGNQGGQSVPDPDYCE